MKNIDGVEKHWRDLHKILRWCEKLARMCENFFKNARKFDRRGVKKYITWFKKKRYGCENNFQQYEWMVDVTVWKLDVNVQIISASAEWNHWDDQDIAQWNCVKIDAPGSELIWKKHSAQIDPISNVVNSLHSCLCFWVQTTSIRTTISDSATFFKSPHPSIYNFSWPLCSKRNLIPTITVTSHLYWSGWHLVLIYVQEIYLPSSSSLMYIIIHAEKKNDPRDENN